MLNIPNNFIAFDLETTGLKVSACKIIEIGAVKVLNGKIVEKYQSFVNPKCNIPWTITNITGIDDSMVEKSLCIEEELPSFINFIGDLPLIAHNASFDMKFLNHDIDRLGLKLNCEVYDTLKLSRKILPNLGNHKLGTVAKHYNIVNEGEHRGIYDAVVVAEIIIKMLAAGHGKKEISNLTLDSLTNTSSSKKQDITIESQKILSCVARMKQEHGIELITLVLKGSKSKQTLDFKTLSTYGVMKDQNSDDIKKYINILLEKGLLTTNNDNSAILWLTKNSLKVLKENKKVHI